MKRLSVLFVALGLIGCAQPSVDLNAERQALLDLHANVLRAHMEDDIDGWLAKEADTLIVGSRGEILFTSVDDRRAQRERYLSAAEFDTYRDLVDPIVTVSEDGTLGWVVCQVEANGNYVDAAGGSVPIEFVSAWVEMYQKIDGEWRMVGNVSNFRPEAESG